VQTPVLLSVKDLKTNKKPNPPCSLEVTGNRTDFAVLKKRIVGMNPHLFQHGAASHLRFLHVFRVQLQTGNTTVI